MELLFRMIVPELKKERLVLMMLNCKFLIERRNRLISTQITSTCLKMELNVLQQLQQEILKAVLKKKTMKMKRFKQSAAERDKKNKFLNQKRRNNLKTIVQHNFFNLLSSNTA